MKIQQRFLLATGVPLLFVVLLFVSIHLITSLTQSASNAARLASLALVQTRLLQSRLVEAQSAMLVYVVMDGRGNLRQYNRRLKAMRAAETALEQLPVGDSQRTSFAKLAALAESEVPRLNAYATWVSTGRSGLALDDIRSPARQQQTRRSRQAFDAFARTELLMVRSAAALQLRYRTVYGRVVNIGFFLAIVVSAGAAIVFGRSLSRAIRERDAVQRRYGLLRKFARDMVKFVDQDSGRIIDANDAALRTYGYTKEEFYALRVDDLRIPDERLAIARHFDEAENTAGGTLFESTGIRRDGTTFPIEISAGSTVLDKKRIIIEIVRDVSDRKRAAEDLRIANERLNARNGELENLNGELESFSYSVSHDLRAPLRAILGYSQILDEDQGERLDAEGRRLLEVVRHEAGRMGTLIDDLLEFSRLSRREMQNSRVDMASLLREVIERQTEAAPNADRTIAIDDIADVNGDPSQLRQVWENLIANAIKYSNKNPKPAIHVRGSVGNGKAVYHVTDNGVGFDMAHAEKLFGVFQRLHQDNEFPGTGVGLAIVQRVVLRHGGRVWADARLGEGATFSFELPREPYHA